MTGAGMLARAGGLTLRLSILGERLDPLHNSACVEPGHRTMNDIPIEESSRVKGKHGQVVE